MKVKSSKKGLDFFGLVPSIATGFAFITIQCSILYNQMFINTALATDSSPRVGELLAKDKIVFATRLNGKMVYAKAEMLLPLEIVWCGPDENPIAPYNYIYKVVPSDLPNRCVSSEISHVYIDGKFPSDLLVNIPLKINIPKYWSLVVDTSANDSKSLDPVSSTRRNLSSRFLSKAGLLSPETNTFLPFSQISTPTISPWGRWGISAIRDIEPLSIRVLYLYCGNGILDLWWTQNDPMPDHIKFYLPEKWLKASKQLEPTLDHSLGGIRIHSTENSQDNGGGLGLYLELKAPAHGLLSSLPGGEELYLRRRLKTIYGSDVFSVALFGFESNGPGYWPGFDDTFIRFYRPSWAKDYLTVSSLKDLRETLPVAVIQKMLEGKSEVVNVRGINLHIRKPSDHEMSHGISEKQIVLMADSVVDMLKAFQAEKLELHYFHDGVNCYYGFHPGGYTSTAVGRIIGGPKDVPMYVLYRLSREPRILVGWGWKERLEPARDNIMPPYTIWP